MIILLKRFFLFLIVALLLFPNSAYAFDVSVSAECAVAMDFHSGKVLFNQNASKAAPMASTTKIMTCLLACESGKLNDNVVITQEMLDGVEGTMLYLNVNDKISLIDLVKGAMLSSGNDAANAIAVFLGGSIGNFVLMMNNRANKIGMTNTVFVTPSGLDDGNHHSTAYDMALLTKTALNNKQFVSVCSSSNDVITVNGKEQTLYNHNKLLSQKNFIGVKTGYTDKSGRCLVSAYRYKDNIIIVVTLSAPDDWQDHKKLIEYSKKQYIKKSDTLQFSVPLVCDGTDECVDCYADYEIFTVGKIITKAYYYPFLYGNVKKGDVIGYVEIFKNDVKIMTVDIIVKE